MTSQIDPELYHNNDDDPHQHMRDEYLHDGEDQPHVMDDEEKEEYEGYLIDNEEEEQDGYGHQDTPFSRTQGNLTSQPHHLMLFLKLWILRTSPSHPWTH